MVKKKTRQIIAEIDEALVVALRHRLLNDKLTYREWLENQIRWYALGGSRFRRFLIREEK